MIPLAICSLSAVTIIILKWMALRRENVLPTALVAEMERLPFGANPNALTPFAAANPSALATLTQVSISHVSLPKVENSQMVETAARREMLKLESGLGALELIVGISPLLGLLGAVAGLVKVFSNLGSGQIAADTLGVALGIAEALNTTIFGLAIAIPTLIAYTYFNKRVESLSVEMESLLAGLLTKSYAPSSSRYEIRTS